MIKDSGTRRQFESGVRHLLDRVNKNGDSRGCYGTHGDSNTRLYKIWTDMKRRCNNPKNKRYSRYGGRGIKVCEEWETSYSCFKEWALSNGYKDNLTIDRIDIDKGYSADNCKWSTMEEQQKNTSRTHYITAKGKTMCMSDWARELGCSPELIKDRINKLKWTDEDAVTVPVGARKGIYGNNR